MTGAKLKLVSSLRMFGNRDKKYIPIITSLVKLGKKLNVFISSFS